MAKTTPTLTTPTLGVSKPKADLTTLRDRLKESAAPATHDAAPDEPAPAGQRRPARTGRTQLIGAHLSVDVGKQLRMIAAEESTDVKTLLIEALNLLFKTRGKPLIAADPKGR